MEEENIYKLAMLKWGVKPQLVILIEEMAELTQAVTKFVRKDYLAEEEILKFDTPENFMEELVDVDLILGQFKRLVNGDRFQEIRRKKLLRLEERLKND